jgi:CheY-like chemotaxis protein
MAPAQQIAQTLFDPRWTAPHNPNGLQVLVVEDDAADAYLINCALSGDPRVGLICRAVDGVEALELLEDPNLTPDIAIIDLHMPRMDGLAFLAELGKRRKRPFPAVVLTSSTAKADLMRSWLRGADLVLTKPDTLRELEVMLRTAIGTVWILLLVAFCFAEPVPTSAQNASAHQGRTGTVLIELAGEPSISLELIAT